MGERVRRVLPPMNFSHLEDLPLTADNPFPAWRVKRWKWLRYLLLWIFYKLPIPFSLRSRCWLRASSGWVLSWLMNTKHLSNKRHSRLAEDKTAYFSFCVQYLEYQWRLTQRETHTHNTEWRATEMRNTTIYCSLLMEEIMGKLASHGNVTSKWWTLKNWRTKK